tara:strand:- start:462 stop:752 length:291 start_codon:yes stop_codon:yes gene_type:complete
MKEPSESLKLRVKENQIKIKKIDMNLEEITKITGGPVITENKISKQGQRLILQLCMVIEELEELTKIGGDIYIYKTEIEIRIDKYKGLIKLLQEDE